MSNFIMLGSADKKKAKRPEFIPRGEMGEQAGYAMEREEDLPF